MPDSPRNRFQFHLSTAILLLFVTGGIVYLNMHRPSDVTVEFRSRPQPSNILRLHGVYNSRAFGWPLPAFADVVEDKRVLASIVENTGYSGNFDEIDFSHINIVRNTLIDVIVALFGIFAACFLCEWAIRRLWRNSSFLKIAKSRC